MKLKNSTVERIYKALVALSRRTLPDINSDLRVAKLRRFFQPLAEPIEEARQKRLIENSREEAGEQKLANAAAVAQANMEIANAYCEFTAPALRIKESDLPKGIKGEASRENPWGGEANRSGVGEIVAELDFLYELEAAE